MNINVKAGINVNNLYVAFKNDVYKLVNVFRVVPVKLIIIGF